MTFDIWTEQISTIFWLWME